VTKEILQKYTFGPEKGNLALLCGPPAMINLNHSRGSTKERQIPFLRSKGIFLQNLLCHMAFLGYKEDENLFGF
jgi:nitrate reductase (NAD(P)H)